MLRPRSVIGSRGRVVAMALSVALVVGALSVSGTAAAVAADFVAAGSARQVYVTGLAPNTQTALVNSTGAVVETRNASSLGGLLFRNVAPGTGYRVRRVSDAATSPKITVHGEGAAQWNPSIYSQSIPSNGYGYLTTRDGTKLAYSVHPPTSPAGEPGLPPGVPIPSTRSVSGTATRTRPAPPTASRSSPT